jgi:hypothetical protein
VATRCTVTRDLGLAACGIAYVSVESITILVDIPIGALSLLTGHVFASVGWHFAFDACKSRVENSYQACLGACPCRPPVPSPFP